MKKVLIFSAILFLFSACTQSPSVLYNTPMKIGNAKLNVQVVSNSADMEQGLSGREKLQDTEGMLFDFKKSNNTRPSFWMKDMEFDLDFIWIKNGKVVEITSDVKALKNNIDILKTYSPKEDVDMVLEVNSGWAQKNRVQINDAVLIEK